MLYIQKLIFELLLRYPTWLIVVDVMYTLAIVIVIGYSVSVIRGMKNGI